MSRNIQYGLTCGDAAVIQADKAILVTARGEFVFARNGNHSLFFMLIWGRAHPLSILSTV